LKSSQEDIELLDAYLKGRLDEASVSLLKARLVEEKQLSDDFKDMQILALGVRSGLLDQKLSMLKNYEQEMFTMEKQKKVLENKKSQPWWKWWLLLVIIGLISYLGYQRIAVSEKKIPDEYKNIYAARFDRELILHKTMRAAVQTDSLTGEQRRAYELYSIQLFDEAIPLLDELWVIQKDTLALFYLGVSKIGVGEKVTGLDILQKPELKKYSDQIKIFIQH
jgi:hypothetical protein